MNISGAPWWSGWGVVVVGIVGGIIVGILLAVGIMRWWRSFRASSRSQKGNDAERIAKKLLVHHGYSVVTSKPIATAHVVVDGQRIEGVLRGDWLVKRGQREFIAEVKSTSRAADPTLPETRRQLLEYWLSEPHRELLLVDTESMTVRQIDFDYRRHTKS